MRESSDIDKQLKAWSEAVDHELADKTPPAPRIPSVLPDTPRRPLLLFPALLAAAALLTVFLAGPHLSRLPEEVPAAPELAANGFETMKPYFQELARLFPGRVLWLSGDGTDLEVKEPDFPSGGEALVLRVELQEEGPDGTWRSVWQQDVLTQGETWVDAPGDAASFWIVGLERGSWLVETHLKLPALFGNPVRKQLTLRHGAGSSSREQVEIAPGLRMVQRLLPLGETLNGENA